MLPNYAIFVENYVLGSGVVSSPTTKYAIRPCMLSLQKTLHLEAIDYQVCYQTTLFMQRTLCLEAIQLPARVLNYNYQVMLYLRQLCVWKLLPTIALYYHQLPSMLPNHAILVENLVLGSYQLELLECSITNYQVYYQTMLSLQQTLHVLRSYNLEYYHKHFSAQYHVLLCNVSLCAQHTQLIWAKAILAWKLRF